MSKIRREPPTIFEVFQVRAQAKSRWKRPQHHLSKYTAANILNKALDTHNAELRARALNKETPP